MIVCEYWTCTIWDRVLPCAPSISDVLPSNPHCLASTLASVSSWSLNCQRTRSLSLCLWILAYCLPPRGHPGFVDWATEWSDSYHLPSRGGYWTLAPRGVTLGILHLFLPYTWSLRHLSPGNATSSNTICCCVLWVTKRKAFLLSLLPGFRNPSAMPFLSGCLLYISLQYGVTRTANDSTPPLSGLGLIFRACPCL